MMILIQNFPAKTISTNISGLINICWKHKQISPEWNEARVTGRKKKKAITGAQAY